jgi:hypothetical protein
VDFVDHHSRYRRYRGLSPLRPATGPFATYLTSFFRSDLSRPPAERQVVARAGTSSQLTTARDGEEGSSPASDLRGSPALEAAPEAAPVQRGRLKVLISAYSCSPGRGSEPGIGWNTAREMA